MKRWFFAVPLLVAAAVFLRPSPADAALHVCNKTDAKVFVAIATTHCIDQKGDCFRDVNGWFNIESGDCATVISDDLDQFGDTNYYYYAAANNAKWSGDYTFCIDPSEAFNYDISSEARCDSNTRVGFREIDTQRQEDYTLTLTP